MGSFTAKLDRQKAQANINGSRPRAEEKTMRVGKRKEEKKKRKQSISMNK